MRTWLIAIVCGALFATGAVAEPQESAHKKMRMTGAALEWASENGRLRPAMEAFPKGGDLHNHLAGAIYAETWLDWAAEDGICADMSVPALRFPEVGKTCEESGWFAAGAARADADMRREIINSLSNRSYVPTLDWSGHADFFATFGRTVSSPKRFGDKLAIVAKRAAQQNTLYLELMETIVFGELFPLVGGIELTGDVAADYQTLMASPFGAKIPEFVRKIRTEIEQANAKKSDLLGCDVDPAAVGCDIEIRFIHQVIREFKPSLVYAQIMLGWAAMDQIDDVVAINLVAPEDGFIALRDYSYHMRMIDHLYQAEGERNVTLHAGELWKGLVRPKQLRFHIREAIELGHAKRIGHGIDIAYEDNSEQLAKKMATEGIMVEINLTSNDTILGVSGADHPLGLYRDLDVPYAISTDDEGVSRGDLTHEYMRLYTSYDIPYQEMKYASRNSLRYSFLPGDSIWRNKDCAAALKDAGTPDVACKRFIKASKKAQLEWELELRFRDYENTLRIPKRKRKTFK